MLPCTACAAPTSGVHYAIHSHTEGVGVPVLVPLVLCRQCNDERHARYLVWKADRVARVQVKQRWMARRFG